MSRDARGPEFSQLVIKVGEAYLAFKHAAGGLVARGESINGFVIAGADKKWLPATVRVEGEAVVVSSLEVTAPVAVRYGWADNPDYNLYNRADLPMSPFRTDAW
jgi:sialate O-acetylesterase